MNHKPLVLFACLLLWNSLYAQLRLTRTPLHAARFNPVEFSWRNARSSTLQNPFSDVVISGLFIGPNNDTTVVAGFCDRQDGSVYRIRFMPRSTGVYQYTIAVVQGNRHREQKGRLEVGPGNAKGPLRNDPEHPSHLVYEGTGEHFFWNSTTAYWLAGWKDDTIIAHSIDRLATLGINRIRVAINGRAHGGERWAEPNVVESEKFTFKLNPWVAKDPESLDHPGFDVSRFNVAHWQKLDRIVARAKERGIIVSLIFYVDGLDNATDPFKKEGMGNAYEQQYYAYAVNRYAAFDNVMWDIANEYHLFRTPAWAEKMGSYLKRIDPYKHLISVHGNADFPFRKAPWVDVVMFQSWDECGGYPFVTEARRLQAATGRILPVVNEEYGYEEHYPVWGCGGTASKVRPDGRSALNRSQLAWEICMAGAYQTTGERADFGTGAGADSGGGWINGRGNDSMTMLPLYRIMKECFERTRYWELLPRNELVSFGNLCLANEGKEYLVYTRAQHCRLQLPANQRYSVLMIDPLTGEATPQPDADSRVDNNAWQYRRNLEGNRVFILKRKP